MRLMAFAVVIVPVMWATERLGEPRKEELVPPAACFSPENPQNHSLAKFERGSFLCFQRITEESLAGPNFFTFDANGKSGLAVRLWTPDAAKLVLNDVSTAEDGSYRAVGTAYSKNGHRTGFLAEVARSGNTTTWIQLGSTIPASVCAAADGSSWTLVMPSMLEGEMEKDHNILQHFARGGRSLGEGLPRSSFKTRTHPAENSNGGMTAVLCAKDHVGFYATDSGEWVELGPDGQTSSRLIIPPVEFVKVVHPDIPLKYAQLTGMTQTSSNAVYATFQDERGPVLYRLDRDALVWVEVETPKTSTNKHLNRVVGSNGHSLLFESSFEDGSQRALNFVDTER